MNTLGNIFGFLARGHRSLSPSVVAATVLPFLAGVAPAQPPSEQVPTQLQDVGVTEHLDSQIDLNLTFTAENGYPVALKQYFNQGRPVILNLVYYTCPMLCSLVLNGQIAALRELDSTPGKDFEIVTISIDPTETFKLAGEKKAAYLASYDRPAPGWHFLVDDAGHAQQLARQVGFNYHYDASSSQYAHPAVIFVLTPEGRLSRYLYGVRFKSFNLRLALAEAAQGKSGLSVDRILLYCFHYDPASNSYTLFARNVMRIGGALSILVLGAMLWLFFRAERRRAHVVNLQ
jgi:protein SCO1/2